MPPPLYFHAHVIRTLRDGKQVLNHVESTVLQDGGQRGDRSIAWIGVVQRVPGPRPRPYRAIFFDARREKGRGTGGPRG